MVAGNDFCARYPEHCGCICAMAHKGIINEETSDGIYPNPLVNSTGIHVTF
jgi:hypothetical protein